MDLSLEIVALLTLVGFLSGFVDAIAGGGGLLTVPALLFAGIPPINVLATNKLQSSLGTAIACYNFSRRGLIDWTRSRWMALMIFAGAALGTIAVQAINPWILGLVVPVLLVLVAIYILVSPPHDR